MWASAGATSGVDTSGISSGSAVKGLYVSNASATVGGLVYVTGGVAAGIPNLITIASVKGYGRSTDRSPSPWPAAARSTSTTCPTLRRQPEGVGQDRLRHRHRGPLLGAEGDRPPQPSDSMDRLHRRCLHHLRLGVRDDDEVVRLGHVHVPGLAGAPAVGDEENPRWGHPSGRLQRQASSPETAGATDDGASDGRRQLTRIGTAARRGGSGVDRGAGRRRACIRRPPAPTAHPSLD